MSLNDKYRGGGAFYYTDRNGQHFTTDLAGRDLVSRDMVEESPAKFTDEDGSEYRVPSWELSDFMKNNIAEGRKVRAMEEWTLPGNSRGGEGNVWLNAFDDVRRKELSDRGWKRVEETNPSILETVFSGKMLDGDSWRAPENRGPDGEGNVAKDVAYHAENVGRGVVGAAVAGATGVVKTIGDLATAGGAFAADALGLDGVASGLRETKRAIDEKAGKVLDWTTDNVLGDAFFNEGDGTREMAKAGLRASEEIGGLYGLGKVVGVAGKGVESVAGAMGKTVGPTAAATGAMAGLMGAQGYEDTISAKEATGKDVTWRDQVAAGINGGVAAAIAPLYGKVAGLLGKEEATRVIQKSYGEMLKRAAVEVAGGAGLGFVQGVGTEAANAVQDGQIREGAAKRVLTAAAVGGALVGATKVPGALGGWVRENRVNYARAATIQGESALAATRAGMPLERSRFTTDDVRAVTQNNEVVFQDGTVYVPARVDGNGKTLSEPKIVINDGTILSPSGKVIGVRGTKLGYMNEIRGEAATPAEAVYRQTDPDAPFKFRIVDPTTGESIENGVLAGLEPPEGVRAWFDAKRAGTELPELDADGHAYTALWLQAHSVNPEISRAAQLGLEQVAAGKMDYRSAAEVVDNAIEQTKGWQYSIYGQFKRSGAVKPEAAAGTEAERAAEPVRTDLPALGNAEEAPRPGGAIPKATTANAELMLGYVNNGTIAPTEVPAAKILPAGETTTVAGAANSGTIIVRQNADGSFTAITGGDKIEEAKQSGAKAIKTVVVKEEDGWTDQASQALALVDALKNGAATPAETVKAVAKLGLSEEDLRGITAAVPDAEGVVKTASNLAPAAMDKLDDANLITIITVGNTVNVRTVGMDWKNVQTKLVDTMPTDVDDNTAFVAGTIAVNAPEMDGVRIWDLAQWAWVNAAMPDVKDALSNGPTGIKTLEDLMAKDSAGTVPVEMPNGELETVNKVEAKAPNAETEVQRIEQADHSLELVAVPAKDGVFHCAQFPTVELKFENGTQYVSGLTPQLMLDSRNREQMGKLLNDIAVKAEQGGYTVAFEDGALVELANDLVQNYVETGRERAMAARAKSVGKVLIKSGLANEIVTDAARFEQALSEYPDGVRLAKDGKTWGFYSPRDGKVYLNGSLEGTRTFLNTTIHEFAHPAVMATRDANPELYNRGMELITETDYYKTVADHPDYAGMSERSKREEALVRLLSDRLEDIKAKVPAKIYKEIEEFVTAFWKRFGEANGIADLTPAMVQTMTIEDIADAIGAEMQSGRKFGTKKMPKAEQMELFGSVEKDTDLKPYRAGEIKMFSDAKAANAKTGLVPANVMQQAGQDRAEMVSALNEMDGLNLPEDIPGKTSFGNASYGKTMENTTVCTRSLGIRSLTSKVAEKLGRPLTVAEQLYIAQDAFNYTDNPQCLYCYVAMDRMAKNEYFASYVKQMQATMSKLAKGSKPAKVYKEFLDGRKDTKVMRARFKMWKELVDKGGQTISMKDVASEDSRAKAAASDPVLELQLKDAEKYAQAASWAKKDAPYRAYNGEILDWSNDAIKKLNAHYGLRFHSFSEASPAFVHEKMQMITDAAVRGLKGLEYTKEPWEVEIFAPTGMNFNIGTFAMHDPDPKTGEYIADGMQGMDWEKAKALREKFPGVSVVFVAVNDSQVEWAGKQDWIDVVIPYHIVRTGGPVAKMMGWKDYKGVQEDAKGEGWTKKDRKAIYPSQHGNDKDTYLALLKKNHLKPRFEKWLDRPWYMKLVQETRRPASETPALQPIFNKDAAYDALEMMQNRGGYFEKIGVTDERENEIAGKMAKAIKDGAQPRPAGTLRLSRGGVYTGSAANYDKPSLFKVGTGEGNQVYGWGLYGSTQRGVAETYAKEISERTMEDGDGVNDGSIRIRGGKDIAPKVEKILTDRGVPKSVVGRIVRVVSGDGKIEDADNELGKWDSWDNEDLHNELADILDEAAALPTVYEQTFFTNRADGDESHLLSWYDPVSEENVSRAINQLDKEFPGERMIDNIRDKRFKSGADLYQTVGNLAKMARVKSKDPVMHEGKSRDQIASEILSRADIDGVKYPVDSYGGKTVKDGDKAGWNYVSFRDDNIRVDHKWRDGEMMFNRGPNAARAVFVAGRARAAEPVDQGEQTPGTLAASRELANQAPTPFSMAGHIHRLALPISEMEWLRKKLTGNVTPAHVGRPAGGGIAAASKSGKVVIEADVFGTVDKTDMAKEKQLLVAHGFFRNEDPTWCAGQTPAAIRMERGRSEDQLATQLLNLAKRRNTGLEAGGQGAARGAFAAEVAKIVMDMPDVPTSTTIGRVKTIGQGVRDYITAQIQYGGGTASSAEASMRHEAGQFLDWCYGGPIVDQATGAMTSRGDQMSLTELTSEMFGKFLIMPERLEQDAPDWSAAIENAIATNPKLTDAWQQLSIRGLTTQAHAHVAAQIAASQSKDHERALAQLDADRREPIKAGGFIADLKEQVVVGMHDTMGPVYIRINEAKKRQIAAKKKLMRTLTPAQRAVVQADIDRFIGQIATDMNKFELARTAWERGAWNEGHRYIIRMMMSLNNMTERDGNTIEDLGMYDNMQRIIETQGRAGSYGINPRQAQLILGDMARRLGAEKWTKLETTDREIHSIMEQEIINDYRFAEAFGQGFADYCRSQTHYVTTKRVFSPEELDAIEKARTQMRRLGIAGGDDVISQMYAYGGRIGAASDVGEANWTAKLKGSMSASQEALSATVTKQMALMNFVRRNHFVIEMRQALLDAGVTGVRDMKRVDGAGYPENKRYGHINYIEDGQKRVLIVPRQISDAMRTQPNTAGIITAINSICRSLYIDYNVAYWNQNINRNNGSIEKNMPGMSEPWVQTIGRAILPGVNKIGMLALEHTIRKMPENVSLPLRLMLGQHTPYYFIPQAKRYADLLADPSAWQKKLWAAEDDGDIATVTEMQNDFAGVMEMLRGNMFVPSHYAYTAGQTKGFLEDVFDRNGLKLVQTAIEEDNARSRFGKVVKAVNIFKKNQAQQEWEDVFAKTKAYLHDRMMFGLQRTVAETGNVVKKNVSIAEGERAGSQKGWIQKFFTQFFNMCEKGNVRHFKAYAERPGETLAKTARTWIGRLIGGLLTSGVIAKIMLDDDEVKGNPKKAAEKYGAAFDYAMFMQRSAQNISKYTKTNAEYQPIWTSPDGYTSIVLAAPLNDEDKVITPTADATVQSIAYAMGIGPAPKWGDAIVNSTIKAVTPDLQASTPIWNLGKTVIASMTDWNPTDQFRQAPMFDKDLHANKFRSLEDAEEFGVAAGMRLWNDFGGRAVIQAPVNGVDNGRGSAPESLEAVLTKIPVLSPAIGRFVKIQVGSPSKRGETVTEDRELNAGAVRLCAKRLLEMSETGIHQSDPKAYEAKIAEWTKTYGLNPFEVMNLRKQYLNGWIQRTNRGAYDQKAIQKLMIEARKQGMDQNDVWLMLGE